MVFKEVKNTSRNEDESKGLEKTEFEIMDEGDDSVALMYPVGQDQDKIKTRSRQDQDKIEI